MLTVLGILFGLLVVVLITALTGYFVAQEFAYMAVDRSRLKARAEAGDASAARALTVTRRTSFMLSGAQLGITVTGLLVGYVAEPLIGSGFGELLSGIGVPVAVGIGVGTVLAVLFSTVVQMVLGELFPKNLAIARPEPVARWLALSTTLYLKLFGWLISLFDASSNLLLRALRIEPVHDVEHSATPRDLEHIVSESRAAGELPAELSVMLDRVLDFPTRTADHAMIPRRAVDHVRVDDRAADVLELMSTGHSRYPVVGDTTDDLRGIISLHDLLAWSASVADAERDGVTVGAVSRPAVVVPVSLPLPDVLVRLREVDEEMALVIDEYGGFAGAVTVEDIAEELVGEIDDEHDIESHDPITADADGGWTVRGDVHIDEVSRAVGHEVPEGDHETIAGLVIAEFAGLPTVGEVIRIPLQPDSADLLAQPDTVGRRHLVAQVRAVERRVPSSLHLSIEVDPVEDGSETDEEVGR
ncbi:hemolysin family protein [Gordonia soli]|uniref:Uncharacterized protein n=1 Tax=Gordonia soli NBRC 108243 TaxID=1223545 RepID=M0QGE8_9ACTN|nr:hemolysin family protein [Gordonia soli]GAC67658.1 hypothetical protein GS4_08_02430 [Gordonia soli NBRC 108243]